MNRFLGLCLILFANVALAQEIELTVPTKPVPPGRFATFNVKVTPDGVKGIVNWHVVERRVPDPGETPLESDLKIDRVDNKEAYLPSGFKPTQLSVTASFTFLKDDKFVTVTQTKDVSFAGLVLPGPTPVPPVVIPVPGPVVPPAPAPVPAPTVTLPDGRYKLAQFSYDSFRGGKVDKATAAAIATGFRQVAQMAGNGAYSDHNAMNAAMSELNRANAGSSLSTVIEVFFNPLRDKLNSLNRGIISIQDRMAAFNEIATGIESYSGAK